MNGYAVLIPQDLLSTSIKLYIYIIYFHTYITIFANNCSHKFNYVDMKKLLLFLSLFLGSCIFISCDNDDEIIQEEEEGSGMIISSFKNILPSEQVIMSLSKGDSAKLTIPIKYIDEDRRKIRGIMMKAFNEEEKEVYKYDRYSSYYIRPIGEADSIRSAKFHWITFEHMNDSTIKCSVGDIEEGDYDIKMIKVTLLISSGSYTAISRISLKE